MRDRLRVLEDKERWYGEADALGIPDVLRRSALTERSRNGGWPSPSCARPRPTGWTRSWWWRSSGPRSAFNAYAVSGVGAMGLMQMMPTTGSFLAHAAGNDAPPPSDALRRRAEHRAGHGLPRIAAPGVRHGRGGAARLQRRPGLRPPPAAEHRGPEALCRRLPARCHPGVAASPGAPCRGRGPAGSVPRRGGRWPPRGRCPPRSESESARDVDMRFCRVRDARPSPRHTLVDGRSACSLALEEDPHGRSRHPAGGERAPPGLAADRHARRPHRRMRSPRRSASCRRSRSPSTSPRCAPSSTSRSMHSPGRSGTDPCPSRGSGDTRYGCSGISGSGPRSTSSRRRRERTGSG